MREMLNVFHLPFLFLLWRKICQAGLSCHFGHSTEILAVGGFNTAKVQNFFWAVAFFSTLGFIFLAKKKIVLL
ncbi:MAG: hypothetical protein ACKVTZ_24220 [Bacteroidia bacterium]